MDTFAELNCGASDDQHHHDHDYKHHHDWDEHLPSYTLIGSLSALTALLGAVAMLKMTWTQIKANAAERVPVLPFAAHFIFFFLCVGCSCMRVPVLHSLCAAQGAFAVASAMQLYVVYTTCYMLQWSLLLAVLLLRILSIFNRVQFTGRKYIVMLTVGVLVIATSTWTANCVRLLTDNSLLDAMNWWLGALSIGSLVAWCNVLSLVFIRAVYQFHVRFSRAEFTDPQRNVTASVELIALATKLSILTVLSALSSVLMFVCVVIIGMLSHEMSGDLAFLLFTAHAIDVAGNCLAIYLAVNIGKEHYKKLCSAVHFGCQTLCIALVRRNHRRAQRQRAELELEIGPSWPSIAKDAAAALALAASAESAAAERRLSHRISRNLNHLCMSSSLVECELAQITEADDGRRQEPERTEAGAEAGDEDAKANNDDAKSESEDGAELKENTLTTAELQICEDDQIIEVALSDPTLTLPTMIATMDESTPSGYH